MLFGHKLSPKFKEDITLVFGVCSMGMGISTIGLMGKYAGGYFSVDRYGNRTCDHLGEWITAVPVLCSVTANLSRIQIQSFREMSL